MSYKPEYIVYTIILLIGIILGCQSMVIFKERTIAYTAGKELGYKEGQIDYANGRVAFELKKQYDGTTQWVKKENPESKEK